MRRTSAVVLAVVLVAACQREPVATSLSGGQQGEKPIVQINKVLKVKVTAGGDITTNGEQTTLEELEAKLAELKEAGGGVWYYRENSAGEPHPNAMKVIELVTKNRLPIRLSAKPDFSDSVDEKGASQPDGR